MEKKTLLLLALILVAGLVLRFHDLGEAHSLQQDEAVSAYDAYSILLTGRDHWGQALPVLFREFGMYNNQLQVYLTVPAVALFGLNEFAARLPWALLGALLPLFAFLIAREAVGAWVGLAGRDVERRPAAFEGKLAGERAGLVAAALAATAPWLLFTSRLALASNLFHVFTAAGVCFFLIGLRKPKLFYASAIAFGLAVNTYSIAIAFVPLFLLSCVLLCGKELLERKREALGALALWVLLCLPVVAGHLGSPQTNFYSASLSVFNENAAYSAHAGANPVVNFLRNFASYFSPDFLFDFGVGMDFHEASINSYYLFKSAGFLPIFMLPLVVFGLLAVVGEAAKGDRRYLLLIAWIVVAAVAAALFYPSPNARRFNATQPAFEVIAAVGVAYLVKKMAGMKGAKKTLLAAALAVIALAAVVSAAAFAYYLYGIAPLDSHKAYFFGFGLKEAVGFAETHPEYDKIFVSLETPASSEPYVYALFYAKYPPKEFQAQEEGKGFTPYGWVKVESVGGRYRFCDFALAGSTASPKCDEAGAAKPLYLLKLDERPELKTIRVLADERGFAWLRLAERNTMPG